MNFKIRVRTRRHNRLIRLHKYLNSIKVERQRLILYLLQEYVHTKWLSSRSWFQELLLIRENNKSVYCIHSDYLVRIERQFPLSTQSDPWLTTLLFFYKIQVWFKKGFEWRRWEMVHIMRWRDSAWNFEFIFLKLRKRIEKPSRKSNDWVENPALHNSKHKTAKWTKQPLLNEQENESVWVWNKKQSPNTMKREGIG